MTTSIPTSTSTAAAAGGSTSGNATLLGAFATLSGNSGASSAAFADMLHQSTGSQLPTDSTATDGTGTTTTDAAAVSSVAIAWPTGPALVLLAPTLLPMLEGVISGTNPAGGELTALTGLEGEAVAVLEDTTETSGTSETDTEASAESATPTREQLETLAAMLAPLWNMLVSQVAAADSGTGTTLDLTVQVNGGQPQTLAVDVATGRPGEAAIASDDASEMADAASTAAETETAAEASATQQTETNSRQSEFSPSLGREVAALLEEAAQSTASATGTATPSRSLAAQGAADFETTTSAETAALQAEMMLQDGTTLQVSVSLASARTAAQTADSTTEDASTAFSDVSWAQAEGMAEAAMTETALATEKSAGRAFTEKNADLSTEADSVVADSAIAGEKNFLSATESGVKSPMAAAGIGVAQSRSTMSTLANTFRRALVSTAESAQPVAVQPELVGHQTGSQTSAATLSTDNNAAPAALGHRAVETVLSLLDAQQSRAVQGGVVNLSFKFGGDDLTVRVQMRGDEVHAQFRTDSTDLRSALASEWRNVSADGSAGAWHLRDPEFVSTTATSSSGSSTQGQSFAQQQNAQQQQQDQARTATLFPELRALRRATNPAAAPEAASSPAALAPSTSLHLTAVA